MPVVADEEVNVRIDKDGISYILESRSVSSVVRFIYTPIDGTFADLELEINSMEPVLPADGGGITIAMGGAEWPADTEEVERHFVSCEPVGNCVEARWQWKRGDELADFLYRFSISGKSLSIELEGGGGKATGVDTGRVTGAAHGRLVEIPYLALGTGVPRVLCSNGVFVSSLIDWEATHSSSLYAPVAPESGAAGFRLNGGCEYAADTEGNRRSLHERFIITVSRHLQEVLPQLPVDRRPLPEPLKSWLWYAVPGIAPSEEGYVELFEQFREFRSWGMDDVLIIHPEDVWHDGDGNATLTLDGAPRKGGGDALEEYLEALRDLGFPYALPANYAVIGAANPHWDRSMAAQQADGSPAPAEAGTYRLRADKAAELAGAHARALVEKYQPAALYVTRHAQEPPWSMLDCGHDRPGACRMDAALAAQRRILASQLEAHAGPVLGEGGMHWLYPGLLHGHLALRAGQAPCHQPMLVDFALEHMHGGQANGGMGTPEQFFGDELKDGDRGSRTAALDRFLSSTIAFGHAGVLPDPATWGLPSVLKAYYMLRRLQACYLGVPVKSVRYHHDGNMLAITEAILSGVYQASQVVVEYANGLQVYVNGSWDSAWHVEHGDRSYLLPPAAYLASMPGGPLVYSADTGSGRVDVAQCDQYFYCDTRLQRTHVGPLTLEGSALLMQRDWEIDILPIEASGEISVDVGHLWPNRRLPPLRLLAFRAEDDAGPEVVRASAQKGRLAFEPTGEHCRYRIALPEWMVEPGR